MTADDTEQRYQVIVTRSGQRTELLAYELLRRRDADEPGPRFACLGELASPECTRTQAYAFALSWLRLTRAEDVPDNGIDFHWGVTEPGAAPTASASGPVVHYAESRRPRWWRRARA